MGTNLLSPIALRLIHTLLVKVRASPFQGSEAYSTLKISGLKGHPEALERGQSFEALTKPPSVRDISKLANIPLSKCSSYLSALEKIGYIQRRPRLMIIDRRMVYILAYCYPLRSIPFVGFEGLERPASYVQKIATIGKEKKMKYALTHLAASEVISPYKFSNLVYFYADLEKVSEWKESLKKVGIAESAKGSIRLLISDLNPFTGAREINGIKVVSSPLLYSDLYSSGEIEVAEWIAKNEVLLNYGNI
ncbi:MAG: hypothetical protein HY362_02955 [Candidatus Aenigmarchaeota archaeon]|nr:hypothetical protein [Candidatus Aenigmarchaeota archaeon]